MDSYKRFNDEDYKNWLKTAESLYILRRNIREFVERETETYHKSLKEKLNGEHCKSNCSLYKCPPKPKRFDICQNCMRWKDEILDNHNSKKMDIHWNNCQSHLWPTDKWEVAKVYMLRGVQKHHSYDDFDISAILNFMSHCKHFADFVKPRHLTEVISVRNKVMHSPDFRLSKKYMDDSIKNVLQLAQILEKHAPALKKISEEINQFNKVLEKYTGGDSQSAKNSKEENMKLLDREQQALKEKIEFLAQRYEEDKPTELKEELLNMKDFFNQNKDLLENLGPQISQMNEIQEKVYEHEEQINTLNIRVDILEKGTADPMFSGTPLKFKNHVFEEARRRNMPEPVFTENPEGIGYRGVVSWNGKTFTGMQICNSRKLAHQEVAMIALEYLKSHPEWSKEHSRPEDSTISSTASSSSNAFYGSVKVFLDNQEVISDGCTQEEEARESAYKKLNYKSLKTTDLERFTCDIPEEPEEQTFQEDDKFFCKLRLKGSFTFHDKCGFKKKKEAEQEVAKVALENLSEVLNCHSLDNVTNYKGLLKERLEALSLKAPHYDIREEGSREEAEGPITSGDNSQSCSNSAVSSTQIISKNACLQPNTNVVQQLPQTDPGNADECSLTETQEIIFQETPRKIPRMDNTGNAFYGSVKVFLDNQEVISDDCAQEEEATNSAYKKLAYNFGLNVLDEGTNFKVAVLEHFKSYGFPPPMEIFADKEEKKSCKLQLSGPFTFYDKDGAQKKKQAEQQAAKVALQHLSKHLNCCSLDDVKNYISLLKERLEALGLKTPEYDCVSSKEVYKGAESLNFSGDNSHGSSGSSMQVISKNPSLQPKDSQNVLQDQPTIQAVNDNIKTETQDSCCADIPNKVPKMDYAEIYKLLDVFHLKSPSVTVESVEVVNKFSIRVHINLDQFTFSNDNTYNNKKDAIRKTYLSFGTALSIVESDTDECKATMMVKKWFSQKKLNLPKEDFKDNKCFLNDVTCSLVYHGEGSTEDEAKQDALQKALSTVPLLFVLKALPKCSSMKETEAQINTLLSTKDQKELNYSENPTLRKISVQLVFTDYSMESTSQRTKKENCNHLSKRILGLLGEVTDPNIVSFKYCLDEWFKKKNLQKPVFEDTENVIGSKVTFSVKMSCSHPDWEENMEAAMEQLIKELKSRFQFLTDE